MPVTIPVITPVITPVVIPVIIPCGHPCDHPCGHPSSQALDGTDEKSPERSKLLFNLQERHTPATRLLHDCYIVTHLLRACYTAVKRTLHAGLHEAAPTIRSRR